jgi:hypothetical protein
LAQASGSGSACAASAVSPACTNIGTRVGHERGDLPAQHSRAPGRERAPCSDETELRPEPVAQACGVADRANGRPARGTSRSPSGTHERQTERNQPNPSRATAVLPHRHRQAPSAIQRASYLPGYHRADTARRAALRVGRLTNQANFHANQGVKWWAVRDSNPRHPRCKRDSVALTPIDTRLPLLTLHLKRHGKSFTVAVVL